MSLRSRTGSSGGRTAAGTLAALSCLALTPRPAPAQMTDMEKEQGQATAAAPGRR
jgi:hypothetical protein